MIRDQLSGHELELLFYHCLSEVGEGLKPLVERYAMFSNTYVAISWLRVPSTGMRVVHSGRVSRGISAPVCLNHIS